MQNAKKRLVEMPLVVARGDAAVVRPHVRAKRMSGHVEPPPVEIEAKRRRDALAKLTLRRGRVVPFDDAQVGTPAAVANRRDERHELFAQAR